MTGKVQIEDVSPNQVWLIADDRMTNDRNHEVGIVVKIDGKNIHMFYMDEVEPYFGPRQSTWMIDTERLVSSAGSVDMSYKMQPSEGSKNLEGFSDGTWSGETLYTDLTVSEEDNLKMVAFREMATSGAESGD